MKLFLTLFSLALITLISCQSNHKVMTYDQKIAQEKEIIKVIEANNTASENENFAELLKTLADSVAFFGTDESEIIKTFAEYKDAIQKQWDLYENTIFNAITNPFITMDDRATVASIIYGVEMETSHNGINEHHFLRVSRNLLKQNGHWVIASGVTSIPRTSYNEAPALPDTISP
ncbi:MAG: hypothetical protein A2X64_04860 [Ignavibacteria bacterium GWF2_33_9]|nr:MAG: hypothetical protein A2X64_04860 [Ignavibacteria bacterium GWF2_33_9]